MFPPAVVPLLTELNDLKRVTSAGRDGSIASRLFQDAWSSLLAEQSAASVTYAITARALAAARLGDIDAAVLGEAGLDRAAITAVLQGAVLDVAPFLADSLRGRLLDAIAADGPPAGREAPRFVAALAAQPRAGVTCPGKPRILLEPPENHAEHCVIVAVYGVLLADRYGADPVQVFIAALAHHFHNAGMPDSGFTGEMLLGPHLQAVIDHFTRRCLAELPPRLRDEVTAARAILPDDSTAEGRAFHAADVLDRVLQINQYSRAATLTPERMLGEMELVHGGPVKDFQDEVLRDAGLL